MDLAILFYWTGLIGAVATLVRAHAYAGWAVLCTVVVVADVGAFAMRPDLAPFVALPLWLALIVLPSVLNAAAGRAARRTAWRRASWLGLAAAVLHPFDGYRHGAALFRALALAERGAWKLAEVRLQRLAQPGAAPVIRGPALSWLAERSGDWRAFLSDDPGLRGDALAIALRIRALGEAGETAAMLDLLDAHKAALSGAGLEGSVLLTLFALTGRPETVALIGRTLLRERPAEAIAIWQARAQIIAGGAEAQAGRATLARIAESSASPPRRHLASLWLERPQPTPAALPEAAGARLDALQAALAAAPEQKARGKTRRLPGTAFLLAANLAAFALEWWSGGTEKSDVLYRLGALWPGAVLRDGQWWRLLTAMFLHAGPIHLGLNMLTLAVIGAALERRFGTRRFLALYLLSGLGSMAAVTLLMWDDRIRTDLLVGASGALMGLIGGLIGFLLTHLRGGSRAAARASLLQIAALILLQSAIDWTTPQISLAGHIGGLLIGLPLGLLLLRGDRRPLPTRTVAPPPGMSRAGLRRRAVAAQFVATAALGATLWLQVDRSRAATRRFARPPPPDMTKIALAAIRRLRFTFMADIDSGAPLVDPATPFGTADAFADLGAIAGEQDAARLGPLFLQVMALLPVFCAKASLAPGTYDLPPAIVAGLNLRRADGLPPVATDGRFAFTDEHARLIRALNWVQPVELTMPPSPDDPEWPVAYVDFTRPYGGRGLFELDMADALGIWIFRGADRRPLFPPGLRARLDDLHHEMHAALQVFVMNARYRL